MSVYSDVYWKLTKDTISSGGGGSSVADDFAGYDSPKYNFNYTIQFILARDLELDEVGNTEMEQMKFAVKHATRPKITIEYQDINYYNFRTRVATRTDYGVASIIFYEDNKNRATNILKKYLNTVSPVSNFKSSNDMDRVGMGETASIGPLSADRHGPITSIILTHHYYDGYAPARTTYTYRNPRFVSIEFGDLDMTTSEVATVGLIFNYDTVNVE